MIKSLPFLSMSSAQKGLKSLKTSNFYEQFFVFAVFFLLPLAVSPLTRDIYTIIKWKIVHLFVIFALFQLGIIHRHLPRLLVNKTFMIACFGILGLWGFEYYFHSIPFVSDVTIDRIGFLVLTLFFMRSFKQSPQTMNTISYALIASMICFAASLLLQNIISFSEFFQGTSMHGRLRYTFGNENMAAQFFGLSILAAFRMVFFQKRMASKIFFCFLFCFFSLFLAKIGCRSIVIGAGLGCTFYGLMQLKTYRKPLLVSGLIAGLIAIPLLLSLRPETVHHRLDMWKNAINIAKDYPLGIGRNKFGFYHVLYQEQDQISPRSEGLIERTPHNELLKYTAEEGWLFILLIFTLIGSFIYSARLSIFQSFQTNEKTHLIGAFALLLLVESVLQFPFELALPYLMITVVLGYFLSLASLNQSKPLPLFISLPLLGTFATISWFVGVGDLAHGAKRFDSSFVEEACHRTPYAWRTCEIHTSHLLQQKQYEKAIEHVLDHLALRPYNFLNLYQLGHAYMVTGQKNLACKFAWFYDRLFYHKSRLRPFVVNECPQKDQEFLLELPLKDHYRTLFSHVSEPLRKKIVHNT